MRSGPSERPHAVQSNNLKHIKMQIASWTRRAPPSPLWCRRFAHQAGDTSIALKPSICRSCTSWEVQSDVILPQRAVKENAFWRSFCAASFTLLCTSRCRRPVCGLNVSAFIFTPIWTSEVIKTFPFPFVRKAASDFGLFYCFLDVLPTKYQLKWEEPDRSVLLQWFIPEKWKPLCLFSVDTTSAWSLFYQSSRSSEGIVTQAPVAGDKVIILQIFIWNLTKKNLRGMLTLARSSNGCLGWDCSLTTIHCIVWTTHPGWRVTMCTILPQCTAQRQWRSCSHLDLSKTERAD